MPEAQRDYLKADSRATLALHCARYLASTGTPFDDAVDIACRHAATGPAPSCRVDEVLAAELVGLITATLLGGEPPSSAALYDELDEGALLVVDPPPLPRCPGATDQAKRSRRGRPISTGSIKGDALAIFLELRAQGMHWRPAADAIEALLSVDEGELSRAMLPKYARVRGPNDRANGEPPPAGIARAREVPWRRHVVEPAAECVQALAQYAIAARIDTIRRRISDPSTGAHGALGDLPDLARQWIERALAELSYGPP